VVNRLKKQGYKGCRKKKNSWGQHTASGGDKGACKWLKEVKEDKRDKREYGKQRFKR